MICRGLGNIKVDTTYEFLEGDCIEGDLIRTLRLWTILVRLFKAIEKYQ